MPEAAVDWTARGAEELTGGFFFSRALSPAALVARESNKVRVLPTVGNRENIPPHGSARRRRSPLPSWYPRSALQDITVIVNAMEMRRARIRADRAQQRSLNGGEAPPVPPLLASPPPSLEQTPSDSVCCQFEGCDTCCSGSTPAAAAAAAAAAESTESSVIELSLLPTSSSTPNPKMLCSSMDEIEKVVMDYLKRTPAKEPAKKNAQRKTANLMSMR